jgi:hypothetical protein
VQLGTSNQVRSERTCSTESRAPVQENVLGTYSQVSAWIENEHHTAVKALEPQVFVVPAIEPLGD